MNGVWIEKEVPWDLFVPLPLPEGEAIIEQFKVSHAVKSLGVWTSPSDSHATHLMHLHGKAVDWLSLMLNGHLPTSLSWMSFLQQLWPRLRYGLGTLTNELAAGQQCLDYVDFKMLSFLGVNRNIRKGWRRLPHTFGGVGLLDLTIEQHICRINLFCQHYGSPSTIGLKLVTSIHWLQMQLGCQGNPLLLDYSLWGHLATKSWIKSFWEAVWFFPGCITLQFASIPYQRTHDCTLMNIALRAGLRTNDLLSFNRCRCASKLIFLSDISKAAGDTIEDWAVHGKSPRISKFEFPPEIPTIHDWRLWNQFWSQARRISPPLGAWTSAPHFQWTWHLDTQSGLLYEAYQDSWNVFEPQIAHRTRLSSGYVRTSSVAILPPSHPVSVTTAYSAGSPIILNPQPGPSLVASPQSIHTVWDLLLSWGGEWMWASIFFPQDCTDLSWLISGIKAGTVIGCTDGSFDEKKSATLCSAGWILYDTTTNTRLAGSFCEYSMGAGSYRGEVLGLCALQLLLLALEEWYHLSDNPTLTIYCDNEKAGERAQTQSRRIKPGWACADVLRSFRDTKLALKSSLLFRHVSAHMDDLLPWEQLSIPEQINCMCDSLAKEALQRGTKEHYSNKSNMLPRELSAVFFDEGKSTTDPAEQLRLSLGRRQAKQFLVQEKEWSPLQFEEVAWGFLHDTLCTKPVAFRLWLSKQHSDFCASGVQMKRCGMSLDDRCPSCWRRKERASHLCICPSDARTSLLEESVRDLERWMNLNDNTNNELCYWLPKYIRARGRIKFSCLGAMSPRMHKLAISQDLIGWRNFMEGRVSLFFATLQEDHLLSSPSRLSVGSWMRTFISKIVHISHAQWILRNFMLHDASSGYLQLKDRIDLINRIEVLSNIPAHEIPEDSRFLLDIDTNQLAEGDLDTQDYWVHAMEAALGALRSRSTQVSLPLRGAPLMAPTGVVTVLEEIRLQRQFSRGMPPVDAVPRPQESSPSHRAASLSSNRRRKPD